MSLKNAVAGKCPSLASWCLHEVTRRCFSLFNVGFLSREPERCELVGLDILPAALCLRLVETQPARGKAFMTNAGGIYTLLMAFSRRPSITPTTGASLIHVMLLILSGKTNVSISGTWQSCRQLVYISSADGVFHSSGPTPEQRHEFCFALV